MTLLVVEISLIAHHFEFFSGEDQARGVKFCTVVHRRPGRGSSYFGELYSPRSQKS